jgi:hypothetical protein
MKTGFTLLFALVCTAQERPADTVVTVSAVEGRRLVDSEATGTRAEINAASLDKLPFATESRGIEAALLSFPGFAANANGAIHPRGAHNQMTYVIDGVPIGDQLTGGFASALDASIAKHIQLFTGDIPAEFGAKVSGVAAITTQSGLGQKAFGSVQLSGGQFGALGNSIQGGGQWKRLGYFGSLTIRESKRFLDAVSTQNLHNGGNAERVFTRLDYQLGAGEFLRVNLMAGRSSFQLANLRSQHQNGQDQRQLLRDYSASASYQRTLSARTTVEAVASYRANLAHLFASPGDTPVTASQARRLATTYLAARADHQHGAHGLRAGVEYQRFPIKEDFTFGVTDPEFDPVPALRPFDLTRGGVLFRFHERGRGSLASGYAQDRVRWKRFLFSLGGRYDVYRFLARGTQLQPRMGVSFSVDETGTVFRASYNRIYQTPVNENLLLSNSPNAIRETGAGAQILIHPERQNVYEAGVQQALWGKAGLNVMYFHKSIRDLHDNDNFFNTGVIFPTSLARANVNGAEMKLTAPAIAHFAGWVSLTHYHAVVTPPFTGGLFLGSNAIQALSAGPFVIDHDQKLGMQTVVQYGPRRGVWTSWSIRYDSGLVSNRSDPAEVARDPDYADLLPYVNLSSDPPRVRPRVLIDASVGIENRRDRKRWEIVAQVTNIANVTALYNFQSTFVGTRLVQPRSASLRTRWFW